MSSGSNDPLPNSPYSATGDDQADSPPTGAYCLNCKVVPIENMRIEPDDFRNLDEKLFEELARFGRKRSLGVLHKLRRKMR
ncbi:MAG: hypothetical protein GF344_14240 [Chitinivibrionales bacterium]|nr:hypothetical protein [Chitinivibrionales bacterium]